MVQTNVKIEETQADKKMYGTRIGCRFHKKLLLNL